MPTINQRRPTSLGSKGCCHSANPLALRQWIRQVARSVVNRAAYTAILFCVCQLDRGVVGYAASTSSPLPGKDLDSEAEPHFACDLLTAEFITPFLDSELFVRGKACGNHNPIPQSLPLPEAPCLQMTELYHNRIHLSTTQFCQQRVRRFPFAAKHLPRCRCAVGESCPARVLTSPKAAGCITPPGRRAGQLCETD